MKFYQLLLLLIVMTFTSSVLSFDPNMQQILSQDTLFYVSESTAPNTVVYVIPDSLHWTKMKYTYKKREGSSYFEVTSRGEVILTKPINFELTNREEFVVNVYNNRTGARVQEYFVTVTADVFDENEAAPVFLEHQDDEFKFDEIPEIGHLITTVSATDEDTADLDKLEFSVDSEYFKIDKKSGELRVAKNLLPSRETNRNHNPGYDPGSHSSSKSPLSAYSLIVTVSDGKFETKKKFIVKLSTKTSKFDMRSAEAPHTQPPNVKTYTLSSQNGLDHLTLILQTPVGILIGVIVTVAFLLAILVVIVYFIFFSRSPSPPAGPAAPGRYGAPGGGGPGHYHHHPGMGVNNSRVHYTAGHPVQSRNTTNPHDMQRLCIYWDPATSNNN